MSAIRIFAGALGLAMGLLVGIAVFADPGFSGNGRNLFGHPVQGRDSVSIESVAQLIKSGQANSIETLLPLLPGDFRASYVMMYHSRSLQSSTFQKPRVIMFEGDGTFALAFGSGDRQLRGADTLETIQFREAERRWEFREFSFTDGGRPTVSAINPARCLECHQSSARTDVDPRPNWEPYNVWPGAYGAFDGSTSPAASVRGGVLKESDSAFLAEQGQEATELKQFTVNVMPTHPRYRYLGPFQPRTTNLSLTDVFVGLNDLRVARLAETSPDWDVYRPLALKNLFCAPFFDDGSHTIPPELLPLHARSIAGFDRENSSDQRGTQSNFVDLLFSIRGIDTSDWSTDFKTGGRFAFEDRFGSPSYPSRQLQNGFLEALHAGDDKVVICQNLDTSLSQSIPAWRSSGRFAEIVRTTTERVNALANYSRANGPNPESWLHRCAACHTGHAPEGPAIAFDNLALLRGQLRKTGYAHGSLLDEIDYRIGDFATAEAQMPPGLPATISERESLLAYLKGLH